MMIRVDNGGTCEEVALTRLAQPDVAASWGKPFLSFFCTALVHPWHILGTSLEVGYFIESQVMGQLLTSMASKSEPKDGQVLALIEGCFLGPSRVEAAAQAIVNRFFTPCNNSMTYDIL